VKVDYIDRLWDIVNWADVTARFDAARAGVNGLRPPVAAE
jgi:Fe-Mn family superoxide dismutase